METPQLKPAVSLYDRMLMQVFHGTIADIYVLSAMARDEAIAHGHIAIVLGWILLMPDGLNYLVEQGLVRAGGAHG